MQKDLSLYAILRTILSELNQQVVDHGDRVAYLYLKMAEYRNQLNRDDLDDMMLACYAHDIGAYKTEKFLDLLKFDIAHSLEHCIYGYLFMKYFSPLKDKAEVLLYHHTYYSERDRYSSPYLDDGILIHFLDRVDIFNIKLADESDIIWQIRNGSGTNFNPQDTEDFLQANEQFGILEKLRNGTYRVDVMNFFNNPERAQRLMIPTINMLAYEVDFKSEQTVIHSVTTSVIAELLGRLTGLGEQDILYLQYAAQLHDLGKIDIPSEIVEKPGRLTADEYHVMKNHVVYTELIISELFPKEIVSIAVKHHERLDGSGYPRGLTANQLTLSDRVLQIADVVSALLQKRTYKQAMDKESVLTILNDEAKAGRLDAQIMDILNREYDSIVKDAMTVAQDVIDRYENLQREFSYYQRKYSESERDVIEEFSLFPKA